MRDAHLLSFCDVRLSRLFVIVSWLGLLVLGCAEVPPKKLGGQRSQKTSRHTVQSNWNADGVKSKYSMRPILLTAVPNQTLATVTVIL
jgi:hypothetical protein